MTVEEIDPVLGGDVGVDEDEGDAADDQEDDAVDDAAPRPHGADVLVRVVTRVHGEEVVLQMGRYGKVVELPSGPRVVVRYPAGTKRFDAVTGHDRSGKWHIHEEDLSVVQQLFPDHVRVVRERWVEGEGKYRTLFGMRFVREDTLRDGGGGKRVLVVVLAPSDAAHEGDSRALVRLVGFAVRERWAQVEVVSLFSVVPDKDDPVGSILASDDPVGGDNDRVIAAAAGRADVVVAAWGNTVTFGSRQPTAVRGRDERVLAILRDAGHEVVHAFVVDEGLSSEAPAILKYPPHPSHVPIQSLLAPWVRPVRAGRVPGGARRKV